MGQPMFGLFKKYDVHLCPEVKGKVLDNGEPVSNLTVHRWLCYTDEVEREDSAITNIKGEFYLPECKIRSKLPGRAFVESITNQLIYIEHKDEKIPLWQAVLEGRQPLEAFNYKLEALNCDLSNPIVTFEFKSDFSQRTYSARGICRWENDFQIY